MYCQCTKYSNQQDLFVSRPESFNFPRPCCCNYKKTKVKGKFGLAYVVETQRTKYCKPFGWQIEFHDTPSRIDYNCKKMVKWVTSPPLGGCSNIETNFWCFPEECGEFLKKEMGAGCPYEKKATCEPPRNRCSCSNEELQRPAKPRHYGCPKCCSANKKSCYYAEKCPESFEKCRCLVNDHYSPERKDSFEKVKGKCKNCKYIEKCDCGPKEKPAEKKLQCKYCKCRSCNTNMCKCCPNCYIEEHICSYCGRIVDKNYFIRKDLKKDDEDTDNVPKHDHKNAEEENDKKEKSKTDESITKNVTEQDVVSKKEEKEIKNTGKPSRRSERRKKECGCEEGEVEAVKDEVAKNEKLIKTTYYDGEPLLQRIKRARQKQKEVVHGSPRASI